MRSRGLAFVGLPPLLIAGCQLIFDIDPNVHIIEPGEAGAPCDPTQVESDRDNCGACGHGCGGGECSGAVCQPFALAHATGNPADIAVDAEYVYWSSDDGTLHRVKKSGGDDETIASGVGNGIGRIVLDAEHIYFRENYDTSLSNTIHAAFKDGASPFVIASDQPGYGGLATDGKALYWARTDGTNIGGLKRAVFEAAGSVKLEDLGPADLPFPQQVAVDDQSLFWAQNVPGGDVLQMPSDGSGAKIQLSACHSGEVVGLAVDEAAVYFTTDYGLVARTDKGDVAPDCDAPSARTLVTDPTHAAALGIALGANLVVWTKPTQGIVSAVTKTGTCSNGPCQRDLATAQSKPGLIAADDLAAYWVNNGDKAIMKVAF